MERTITVKGVGKVQLAPDLVELSLEIESTDVDYESAMADAASKIEKLTEAVQRVGFAKESLKTKSFDVDTDYTWDDKREKHIFVGYKVDHELKLEFNLDMSLLFRVFSALSSCNVEPEISVQFTLKDTEAVNEALLRSATENAKRKAQILCMASGNQLGQLLSISYNWADINVYSNTHYSRRSNLAPISINPDDIKVSDSATFVWEIV